MSKSDEKKRIRMSVGFAKSRASKTIRLSDFGDANAIKVELSLESGTYGAAVGYVEITGVEKK